MSKGEKDQSKSKEGLLGRGAKIYRTVNFLTASGLLAGAVIFPEYAPVLVGLAAIDIAQGGIVEYLRRRSQRKKEAKTAAQTQPAPA